MKDKKLETKFDIPHELKEFDQSVAMDKAQAQIKVLVDQVRREQNDFIYRHINLSVSPLIRFLLDLFPKWKLLWKFITWKYEINIVHHPDNASELWMRVKPFRSKKMVEYHYSPKWLKDWKLSNQL